MTVASGIASFKFITLIPGTGSGPAVLVCVHVELNKTSEGCISFFKYPCKIQTCQKEKY